ncbi:MAG: hypothetical protein ACI81S_000087 [Sphingobacteriales bacterium]|jgi:hypothetical protein
MNYATSNAKFAHGISFNNEIFLGRLGLNVGFGRYLVFHNPYKIKYYSNIGLNYFITNNISAHMFLKSHREQADYMDFGFNFLLRKSKSKKLKY